MLSGTFPAFLEVCALIGASCAGFILAQAVNRRANQLAAGLVLGASWWALCNANVDGATDPETVLMWMRLGAPGWAFLGGFLPHMSLRYFDIYPTGELERARRAARVATCVGYGAGVFILLAVILFPEGVYRDLHAVPWGWNQVPGPLQLVYFSFAVPSAMVVFPLAYTGFHSSVAVAPIGQRVSLYVSMLIPAVAIGMTELTLPIARVDFPRFGAASYSLFGLIFVVAVLRYGFTFLTPNRFSDETLDTLNDGVAMLTPSGRIRHVNPSLVRMAGGRSEDLVGMPLDRLFGCEVPLKHGMAEEPAELRTQSGDMIPVSLSVAEIRDQQDNVMGTVVAVRDMREIQTLRRQMVTQARLAAVGELAAGVAHEINNPLSFMRTNLSQIEIYVKTLADGPGGPGRSDADRDTTLRDAIEAIHESIEGVDRVSSVVQGVRRFTDRGTMERESLCLNSLLEDAIAMARLQDRSGRIAIEFEPGPLPDVPCAPQDVRQVLLNLLVNGMEAVERDGRIRVATFSDAGVAVAEISDTGRGMTADEIARAFDPFYTTKTTGDGAGLGLTIAWHVIDAHGGNIDIESAPGRGTTMRVRMPA